MDNERSMGIPAAALAVLRARLSIRAGKGQLSLRDLGKETDVGHTQWRTILAGGDPRYSTLERIARSQNITVSELLELGEDAIAQAAE